MKLGVLFSGGKDSMMGLDWAYSNFEVGCLIALKSKNRESYMFHVPNIDLVKKQAKSMKIPLIFRETEGKKEEELIDLKKAVKQAIKKYKIEGLVAGALESKYQRNRIESICEDLMIKPFSPYWHFNPIEYMNLIIQKRYKVLISAVAAEGLTEKYLGVKITPKLLTELNTLSKKYKFHLAGEGGEYETFVFDGPLFKREVKFKVKKKIWRGASGEIIYS